MKKRRQSKPIEIEPLIDIIRKHNLLNESKISKAVSLNYDIVQGCTVTIDKNQKRLTIEHILPREKERNIIFSMNDSRVLLTKDNLPHKIVGDFLYQICLPIYYYVAKANNWGLSWIDRHIKPSRGDYWNKDTNIKVTAYPMSKKERTDYIFKETWDKYFSIKMEKAKSENQMKAAEELFVDKKNFKAFFISELKNLGLIDNRLKVLCTQARFKKESKRIGIKFADPESEIVKQCPRCGETFRVTSKHDRGFCKDPCRSSAHTEAKRRIKQYLKSPGLEMKNIHAKYSAKKNGFIIRVTLPSKKTELSCVIDLSGNIRDEKIEKVKHIELSHGD